MSGYFTTLNDVLQKVILKLLDNNNLCKLLYYKDGTPLSRTNVINPTDLYKSKILPHSFNTEFGEVDVKVFVHWGYTNGDKSLKNHTLIINVVTHNDLYYIDGGFRPYRILEEIDKTMNEVGFLGIGEAKFMSYMEEPYKNKTGCIVSYKIVDFDKVSWK